MVLGVVFLAIGVWCAGSLTLALALTLAAVSGFHVRSAATAVVARRVSLWALLGDGEGDPPLPALVQGEPIAQRDPDEEGPRSV